MTTASDIRTALRVKYPVSEYALLFEVGASTGFGNRGWADALVMNLWPSRGLTLTGFEIKVSRHDWRRELKNPAKAEEFVSMCDHWCIVAPAGIVMAEELPSTWGLLELRKDGKLHSVVAPPKLQGAGTTLRRDFVAAMLRRASESDKQELEDRIDAAVKEKTANIEKQVEYRATQKVSEGREVLAKVGAVKAALGIDLTEWQPAEDIINAIQFALGSNIAGRYSGLRSLADRLDEQAKEIRKQLGKHVEKAKVAA